MALSRIWSAFIIVAIVVASIKCFFFGQTDIFNWMVIGKSSDPLNPLKLDGIIETCWIAVDLCIKLIGTLALFMGLMSIAEKAGGIRLLSRIIGPFFSKLFPDIPEGHPSMGHMIMN
ncbi:MAG: spore maturation protein, partial [Pedobacter sp.]